jgi:hypothetical protein
LKDEVFENFLRRHNHEEDRKPPRELFQVAVFYFRPIAEEINLEHEEKAQEIIKNAGFWKRGKTTFALQNISYFVKQLLNEQKFVFPFYSEDVFMFPKEAENYIPRFIKKLIGEGKIPEEAIKDHTINYEIIETGIVPLNLATLERVDEFKDIKLPM